MEDEVLKSVGIVALCFLAVIITFFTIAGIRYFVMSEANAEPVTTEIPEYTMKCTVFEDTCKEYTIYRITRN